jgi:transposase-like protein
MDRSSLELLLERGESVERIAKRFGKDPSTVSYWMKKYGLTSPYMEKQSRRAVWSGRGWSPWSQLGFR